MYNQVSPTALDSVRSLYNQGISKSPTLHLPTPHVPLTVTSSDQSRNSYGNQTVSKLFDSSHVFPHLPASSHTSLIASGIKKAKPKGQTPVMSTKSSSLSSKAASRWSAKAAQAGSSSNLSTSLTIHGMAGAILHVGNTFNCGLECMVSPPTTSPQAKQPIAPQASNTQDVRRLAMSMVKANNHLSIAIRGKLVLAFLSDTSLALLYIELADTPNIQVEFIAEWSRRTYGDSLVVVQPTTTDPADQFGVTSSSASFDRFNSAVLVEDNFTFSVVSVTVQMDPYPFPPLTTLQHAHLPIYHLACNPQTSPLEEAAWSRTKSCQWTVYFSFHYLAMILLDRTEI